MILRFIFILLALLSWTGSMAQRAMPVVPFERDGKWGYMDKNQNVIVEPIYDEAHPPFNHVSRYKLNGKYGYMKGDGTLLTKAKYKEAEDFWHGIAKVKRGKKYFHIKTDGEKNKQMISVCGTHRCLTPRINSNMEMFESEDGKVGFVHSQKYMGKASIDTVQAVYDSIVPISHQLMYIKKDGKLDIVHEGSFGLDPQSVIDNLSFEYDDIKLFSCEFCSEGLVHIFAFKKNDKWGFYKLYGHPDEEIEFKYKEVLAYAGGYLKVEYQEGRYGYVDGLFNEYFVRN